MLLNTSYSLKKVVTIVAIFLFIYGIVVEVLQTELTKNRVGEFEDVIANVLGIIFGAVTFRYIINWKLKYNKGLFF